MFVSIHPRRYKQPGCLFYSPRRPKNRKGALAKEKSGNENRCTCYLEGFSERVSSYFILGIVDISGLVGGGAPMNNGDRFDLLADRARVVLDRQMLEAGGQALWSLEHKLRLFVELVELLEHGNILPGNSILIETSQELQNALNHFELAPVALFKRIEKA